MKAFISHSSKDSEVAKKFSSFLSELSIEVSIFCSFLNLNQGDDFVEIIEHGLKDCDVFIPLISTNYLSSKYCMIELGYAYSRYVDKSGKFFIFPFCLPPITKDQALIGTPLSHIQTEQINDKVKLHKFVNILQKKNILPNVFLENEMINDLVDGVNTIIMNKENILSQAVIQAVCSDLSNPNAILHECVDQKHVVNFNLNANKKNVRPDFISMVLKFPGLFSFYDFLRSNADIRFICDINNYTESLTGIDIEFKYHETHQILKKYQIELSQGTNSVEIPIKEMNIEGLKQISEICFVAWDRYIVEEEGMFIIENIQVK